MRRKQGINVKHITRVPVIVQLLLIPIGVSSTAVALPPRLITAEQVLSNGPEGDCTLTHAFAQFAPAKAARLHEALSSKLGHYRGRPVVLAHVFEMA